jgi:hypothetical protein
MPLGMKNKAIVLNSLNSLPAEFPHTMTVQGTIIKRTFVFWLKN